MPGSSTGRCYSGPSSSGSRNLHSQKRKLRCLSPTKETSNPFYLPPLSLPIFFLAVTLDSGQLAKANVPISAVAHTPSSFSRGLIMITSLLLLHNLYSADHHPSFTNGVKMSLDATLYLLPNFWRSF